MKQSFRIYIAITLLSIAARSSALECSAACPTKPVGILDAPFGLAFVSPPNISESYTGCQVAWDTNENKKIVLEFVSGTLIKAQISKVTNEGNILCIYEDGKLTSRSPLECSDFNRESRFRGIDTIPVEDSKLEWPDGQCLPAIRFMEK